MLYLLRTILQSCREQSNDFQSTSVDWFHCDGNMGLNMGHWSLSIPPENTRKPKIFCFQGLQKETSSMKWVKPPIKFPLKLRQTQRNLLPVGLFLQLRVQYVLLLVFIDLALTQSVFTSSKLTIETLEQGVKYV